MNKIRKITSVLLATLIVLAVTPIGMFTAFAESKVYGLCVQGSFKYNFYSCNSEGVSTGQKVDPETVTDLFVDGNTIENFYSLILENQTVLKSVKFLNGVENIDDYALYGFKNLEKVDFGNTVKYIGEHAFSETALTEVTFPENIEYINYNAFDDCAHLSTVTNNSSNSFQLLFSYSVDIDPHSTWQRNAEISTLSFNIPCGEQFALNLYTAGTSGKVTWHEYLSAPLENVLSGLTVTEAGVLSGTAPDSEQAIDITLDPISSIESETITSYLIHLNFYIPEKYDVELSGENVTVTSGKIGKDAATELKNYVLNIEPKIADKLFKAKVRAVDSSNESKHTLVFGFTDGKLVVPAYELEELKDSGYEKIVIEFSTYISEEVMQKKAESPNLPFETSFAINSKNGTAIFGGEERYCEKLYKFDFKKNDIVDFSWYSDNSYCDTCLKIYTFNGETFTQVESYDNDNAGFVAEDSSHAYGEKNFFKVPYDGTYYILPTLIDEDDLDITATFKIQKRLADKTLDFTQNNTAANGDKYSWNQSSKTLVLKDGFLINVLDNCAIILPGGSKVTVEGQVTVRSLSDSESNSFDGICVPDGKNLDIELNAGAELTVLSSYGNAVSLNGGKLTVTGKVNSNGELPVLKTESYAASLLAGKNSGENPLQGEIAIKNCNISLYAQEDSSVITHNGSISLDGCTGNIYSEAGNILRLKRIDGTAINGNYNLNIANCELSLAAAWNVGIQSEHGGINVENSKMYVSGNDNGIRVENGNVTVKNSDCSIFSYNEDGIYISGKGNVEITDSELDIYAENIGIRVKNGSVALKNNDCNIYSSGKDGIHIEGKGDITAAGGRLITISSNACLETDNGMINLSNIRLSLLSNSLKKVICIRKNDGIDVSQFTVPNEFKLVDYESADEEEGNAEIVRNVLYKGKWQSSLLKYNSENEEYTINATLLTSVIADGKKEDVTANLITELKSEYIKGEKLQFEAAVTPELPVYDTVGYAPYKWEIVGTDFSDEWIGFNYVFSDSVSTSKLKPGTYTLRITYAKGVYNIVAGWNFDRDTNDELTDTVTVEKTFTVKDESGDTNNGNTNNAGNGNNAINTVTGTNNSVSPKTGDTAKPFIAFTALILSAGTLLVLNKKVHGLFSKIQ